MKKIVIVGLGYIGLPTAALIASKNINVIGVDKKRHVVNKVNNGEIHIIEPGLQKLVSNVVKNKYLRAQTNLASGDVYVIVVPTPIKSNMEPDISYVEAAAKEVIPKLKKNDLFIIESTSPVGTTEKINKLILSYRPELKNSIHVAYCPERVLPGNAIFELENNDRVVGGVDNTSTQKAYEFYSLFVNGKIHKTNSRTAEMCKLVENSSRDAQIAFANELSMICDKADIDVNELINLANKHPRVNILNPGTGVGGHCIAVDPYFLISSFNKESEIISLSRKVNHKKEEWCFNKIINEVTSFKNNKNRMPLVALLGITFKPNIDDLRESPSLRIVKKVLNEIGKENTLIVEPNLKSTKIFELSSIKNAFNKADLFFLLVAHKEFKALELKNSQKLISFVKV